MEFRKVHSYTIAPLSVKTERAISQDARPGIGKTTGLTCMIGYNPKNIIFSGHSSGAIYAWRRAKNLAAALVDGSAEKGGPILPAGGYESLKSPKSMHGGAVTAIKIQPSTGLLYTGGADRLVKVWDVFNSEKPPACVHAFRAHGGSVTCLEFGCVGPSPGFLFTGGTDSAVVVWKDAEGRGMMLYPFYVKHQVVELKAWPTALAFAPTRMNSGELLVGLDAQIWRLRVDADARAPRGALEAWERDREVGHKLAVTTVVVQMTDGMVFSLGNDALFKVWELGTGAMRRALQSESRARFLGACLDTRNQSLIAVDAAGWAYVWSWVSERLLFAERIIDQCAPGPEM